MKSPHCRHRPSKCCIFQGLCPGSGTLPAGVGGGLSESVPGGQVLVKQIKENAQFINSDKFAKDETEEIERQREYEKNTDPEKHIDTPLCIENEKNILSEIGFKKIEFKDINSEKYKLMICQK